MSSDEEIQLRGRIVTEYIEAKNSMVALEAQAATIIEALSAVAEALNTNTFEGPSYATARATFPKPDQIWQLVYDITSTQRKLASAQEKLGRLGVELK
jgi:hypothetical protein